LLPLTFFIIAPIQALLISFLFIWVRASYPRIRYDRLISLTWKSFLPFSLSILICSLPILLLL
jgi:NADH:ubiquinone oxidoreductase subunit H